MSDTSQGPGWWLASDGKWYPPELWTGPPDGAVRRRPDRDPTPSASTCVPAALSGNRLRPPVPARPPLRHAAPLLARGPRRHRAARPYPGYRLRLRRGRRPTAVPAHRQEDERPGHRRRSSAAAPGSSSSCPPSSASSSASSPARRSGGPSGCPEWRRPRPRGHHRAVRLDRAARGHPRALGAPNNNTNSGVVLTHRRRWQPVQLATGQH